MGLMSGITCPLCASTVYVRDATHHQDGSYVQSGAHRCGSYPSGSVEVTENCDALGARTYDIQYIGPVTPPPVMPSRYSRAGITGRPAQEPVKDVPHIPTALRGYRTWRVAYSTNSITGEKVGVLPGLYAKSINNAEPWKSGVTVAACAGRGAFYSQPAAHAAPRRNCECGLYAWYRPERVEPVHGTTRRMFGGFAIGGLYDGDPEPEIVGVIEGAGRVLKFARGFKAEKARIIAIYAADAAQAEMIRATYPDTRLFDDKAAMLEALPAEIEERTTEDFVRDRVNGWYSGGAGAAGLMPAGMQILPSSVNVKFSAKNFADSLKRSLGLPAWVDETPDEPTEETDQERALRLRQSRNTGPGVGSFRTDGKRKKGGR